MKHHKGGKRVRPGTGKGHVIRLLLATLCVCAMVIFSSPGQLLQEPVYVTAQPQPGPDRVEITWKPYRKVAPREGDPLSICRPDLEEKKQPPYDHSQPVPESDPVDNNYFADAAFVGDSRTDGLLIYSGITGAANLSYKGLTVESAQDKPVQFTGRRDKVTALEALAEESYGKVYVMLGVNELGWSGTEQYHDGYDSLLTEIRRLQPDAVVYIQATLPVSLGVERQRAYLNNERIREYNEVARQLAEDHQMYYLDVGQCLADETGALPEEAGVDGVHLTRPYYVKWAEYLKSHTVEEKSE